MTRIYLSHPDQATRNALIQTFKFVFPEAVWADNPDADAIIWHLSGTPMRLKALIGQMRHDLRKRERPAAFPIGNAEIDVHARLFKSTDDAVTLTEKEIDLLLYLWLRKTPATRDDLLKDVWGYAADVDTHTIETHIYRLRQKIEPDSDNPQFLITTKDGYQIAASSKA